jgi:hypothetical protein
MRRAAAVLIALAISGLLTACSPGQDGIAAIGYDMNGRLVGAVKVCGEEMVEAELVRSHGPNLTWHRASPLQGGTDSWPLQGASAGTWTADRGSLSALASRDHYVFVVWSEGRAYRSQFLDFYGKDVTGLKPGEVLTGQLGSADPESRVIALDELSGESC